MSKTAQGLVEYCKAQLGLPYWWGTYGQTATAALYREKKAQYPGYYTADNFMSQLGKRVHDCVGLIKGYLWSATPTSTPVYTASEDCNVPMLYNRCTRRGNLSGMPDIPGVCVFMASMSHVGVYIGDGYVIEARGHAYGVVKTRLEDRGWALWGMPKYIDYSDTKPAEVKKVTVTVPQLQQGSEGNSVKKLQILLNGLGYNCGPVDGDFGERTAWAVKSYQTHFGLTADGIVGPQTWNSILN